MRKIVIAARTSASSALVGSEFFFLFFFFIVRSDSWNRDSRAHLVVVLLCWFRDNTIYLKNS